MKFSPPTGALCAKLAVAFLWTGSVCLAQDSGNNSNNGNDVSALKTQMQKMQSDYDAQVNKIQK